MHEPTNEPTNVHTKTFGSHLKIKTTIFYNGFCYMICTILLLSIWPLQTNVKISSRIVKIFLVILWLLRCLCMVRFVSTMITKRYRVKEIGRISVMLF